MDRPIASINLSGAVKRAVARRLRASGLGLFGVFDRSRDGSAYLSIRRIDPGPGHSFREVAKLRLSDHPRSSRSRDVTHEWVGTREECLAKLAVFVDRIIDSERKKGVA